MLNRHLIKKSPLASKKSPTREEILDTAERLFASQGWDGVSVRDITSAAKVNLAAINYHFGSKQGLISAVLERRIVPINQARIAALENMEQADGNHSISLEVLLEAFIRPTVLQALDPKQGGSNLLKLLGRSFSQPGEAIEKLMIQLCEPMFKRFDQAWLRALPDLTLDEIYWRISFTHGALHHWLLTIDNPVLGRVVPGTLEEQLQRLIQFAAAGLRAPMITNASQP